MTGRRLVRLTAALLDSAFLRGFSLRGWIVPASSVAGTELAKRAPSHSLPTFRLFGRDRAADQFGRPAGAGCEPVSPGAYGPCLYSLPPLAAGAGRSNSSRSQQIPLLVGGLNRRFSDLHGEAFPGHLTRLGRRSLNPTLSLRGGVA
jgi:hypothetical protein